MAINYVHPDKLLEALDAIAFHADCAGTAYAHQAAIIRQGIARIIELTAECEELKNAKASCGVVAADGVPVIDGDGPVNGFRACVNCED